MSPQGARLAGGQLAQLSQHSCGHWAATSTADAQAALLSLEDTELQSAAAAALWVRFGPDATEPYFLDIFVQMRQAGLELCAC